MESAKLKYDNSQKNLAPGLFVLSQIWRFHYLRCLNSIYVEKDKGRKRS